MIPKNAYFKGMFLAIGWRNLKRCKRQKRRDKMIQFIAGTIFGAVFGFMILAIVTAGRDE